MVNIYTRQEKTAFFYKLSGLLNCGMSWEEIAKSFSSKNYREKKAIDAVSKGEKFYDSIKNVFGLSHLEKALFFNNDKIDDINSALSSLKKYDMSVKKVKKKSFFYFGILSSILISGALFLEKFIRYLVAQLQAAFPNDAEPFILSFLEYILSIKPLLFAVLTIFSAMLFMFYVINPVLFDKITLKFFFTRNIKKYAFFK